MNRFFKLTAAAFMAVFFANNSIADNQGISIGVWGSQLDLDTYGTETQAQIAADGENDVTSNSQSKSVDVGSVFIEYTAEQGSSIGIEYYPGDATLGSVSRTDTCVCQADASAAGGGTSATYTAKADVTDIWSVYMEPTVMFNDTFGVYGKVGVTTLYLKSLESLSNGTDSSTYPNADIWGVFYGLGVKARHSSGLFLKLETSITEFQSIKLQSLSGNKGRIDADLDVQSTRLALGYTF